MPLHPLHVATFSLSASAPPPWSSDHKYLSCSYNKQQAWLLFKRKRRVCLYGVEAFSTLAPAPSPRSMPSPVITSTRAFQRTLLWLQGICLLPGHIPAASPTWDYDTISLPRAPNPQGLVSYLAYWLQPLRGKTEPAKTLVHSLQLL